MSKAEINSISKRIIEAVNNTTNDYDAREVISQIISQIT